MITIMTTYERLWRLLSGSEGNGGKPDSFSAACRRLRVSPYDLEEVLLNELGMTGEEIISIYKG